MGLVDQLLSEMTKVKNGLIFVNLVDFDTKFGHRRDVAGYALALEQLDNRLPEIESKLEIIQSEDSLYSGTNREPSREINIKY